MKKILLSSVIAIAILTGCTEDKKVAESKPVVEETKKIETATEVETPEVKLVEQVKNSAVEVANKIAEESKKVAQIGTEAVKSVSEKVAVKTEELTQEVVQATTETKDKIEQSIDTIVATKSETKEASDDLVAKGKDLYLKCTGCHGKSGEKVALGKSEIIKGWDKEKIVASLKGYKDGSYGGVMKGVMKSQVANLSDEEIEILSAYISTF